MSTYCWEETFTDDRSTLTEGGAEIGYVEPVGGSWQVVYGRAKIAMRPDKASAQACLNKYHLAHGAANSVRTARAARRRRGLARLISARTPEHETEKGQ